MHAPYLLASGLSGEDFGPDTRIVHMPSDVAGKRELLEYMAERLDFPAYFGYNWDALSDCLKDLAWVQERRVVLVHASLPRRLGEADLKTYLDVLADAVLDWRESGEAHELIVVFAAADGALIRALTGWPWN
ncbi:MAG: barstar family protein [Gemmatimonadetes bacterium]|nr:barstar family protein [Gemmatimonadota bacterium]